MPLSVAVACFGLGLYLLGYSISDGWYSWARSFGAGGSGNKLTIVLNSIGALLLIAAVMGNDRLFAALGGRGARALGAISFPLYLVHVLVIASVSSAVFVRLTVAGVPPGAVLALVFAVTVGVSVAVAVPLGRLDRTWVVLVDAAVRRLAAVRIAER